MNPLLATVRKHHCLGTHQRFAIDALAGMQTDSGRRLSAWLLHHYRRYLEGATDPDLRFRDYHNHVIHVRDGYWGGAPRVAHQWYERLLRYLREERFDDAAHAAGVLSHYITDVMFPLHTISTPREALIHRPMEWSVENAYDRILHRISTLQLSVQLDLSSRPGWLGSMMMHAARFAEQRSERLVQRYSFPDGAHVAGQGLDDGSLDTFAELFALSITATTRVLCRAAADVETYTGYPLADCGTGWTGLRRTRTGAILSIPWSRCRKVLRRRREGAAVAAIANEYLQTGQLREHLPAEVDIKRRVIDIHRREICRRSPSRIAA